MASHAKRSRSAPCGLEALAPVAYSSIQRWLPFSALLALFCTSSYSQRCVKETAEDSFNELVQMATSPSTFLRGASTMYKIGRLLGRIPCPSSPFLRFVLDELTHWIHDTKIDIAALHLLSFVSDVTHNRDQVRDLINKAITYTEHSHSNEVRLEDVEHALGALCSKEKALPVAKKLHSFDLPAEAGNGNDPDFVSDDSDSDSDSESEADMIDIDGDKYPNARAFVEGMTIGDFIDNDCFDLDMETNDRLCYDTDCSNLRCSGIGELVAAHDGPQELSDYVNDQMNSSLWCLCENRRAKKSIIRSKFTQWRSAALADPESAVDDIPW